MRRVEVTSDCPEIKPFRGNSMLIEAYFVRPRGGYSGPYVWIDADNPDRSGWFDRQKVEEVTE